jgi:tRNA (Thr-GGU) A37 N-methylase
MRAVRLRVAMTTAHRRARILSLHPVTVREIDPPSREGYDATSSIRVKIGAIEVFDGTPVVDSTQRRREPTHRRSHYPEARRS